MFPPGRYRDAIGTGSGAFGVIWQEWKPCYPGQHWTLLHVRGRGGDSTTFDTTTRAGMKSDGSMKWGGFSNRRNPVYGARYGAFPRSDGLRTGNTLRRALESIYGGRFGC
jgi:hypothetical protein